MTHNKCPQKGCGAPALLLLSLVCANPRCQNYDTTWHVETTSKPRYTHNTIGEQTFIGGFSYNNEYYDLYHSINPLDEEEWVEARYGDDIRCYLGSELVFANLDENEVVREAARRWNERLDV